MEDKSINAGKVGLTMGGDWKSSESYEKLTCVSHNGRSWAAKKNVSAGVEPSEANSAFWQLMSDRGVQGIQGPVGPQGNSAFDGTGVEIVNNLTQGGQTAVLSAEQGKVLKTELTELESEISGKILFSGNRTIASGQYRSIITGFPQVSIDTYGYVLVNGLKEGRVEFVTSSWSGDVVNFIEGEKVYCIIPANRPNFIVANKDSVAVSENTNITIEVVCEGVYNQINYTEKENERFKDSIPFMDISALHPTSGNDGTDIFNSASARELVPEDKRKQGLILIYKTSSNDVIIEQYASNKLDGTSWKYGTWQRLGISDVVNINRLNFKTDAYDSIDAALSAVPSYWQRGGIIVRFKLASGWVTMQLNNDSWTKVESSWQTIATNIDIAELCASLVSKARKQSFEILLDELDLVNAYWEGTNLLPNSTRVANAMPIPVHKGDELSINDYGFEFAYTIYDAQGNQLAFRNYGYSPATMEADGTLTITIRKREDTNAAFAIAEGSNVAKIKRYGLDDFLRPNIEYSRIQDLTKGYINTNNDISTHSARFVNWRRMRVFKGDYVYSPLHNIQFIVKEYSNEGTFIVSSEGYHQSYANREGSNYCGPYIVKNDGYIMCQCADINSDTSINLSNYDKAICVIHREKTSIEKSISYIHSVTPTSSKRGKDINLPSDIGHEMQTGTIINDQLWVQVDDYSGNRAIKVVDKNSGELIRTIVADVHGSCAYNQYNDCLLLSDENNIYLFFNPASIGNALSLSSANHVVKCSNSAMVYCWGEDNRTIYGAKMYDESAGSENNLVIEKLLLGVDSDNSYNGSVSKLVTYSGKVAEGIDTYHGYGQFNVNYVQDLDYDGYLYLGLGTSGNNFLVIDLDEDSMTYRIIGNYCFKSYDNNRKELFLEPELVAIDEQYIYLGSRSWGENTFALKKIVRN